MPTVTFGDNTGNTYSGTDDAEINSFFDTTNQGSVATFELRDAASTPNNGLIRFTQLSTALGGDAPITVSAATLYLWLTQEGGFSTPTLTGRRLLVSFTEGQTTWNVRATAINWNTAGALGDGTDRVATAVATGVVGDGTGEYYAITVDPAYIEGVVNGTMSDYGLVLELGTGDFKKFATSEGTDGQRPYLEVTYSAASSGGVRGGLVGGRLLRGLMKL